MKIGMILDAPFPPDYRVEKEALTLMQVGHSVFLFCLDYKNANPRESYKGIQLVRYKSNKLEYKLSALAYTVPFYHWFMRRKLERFIREFNPDVLHVHDMVIAAAVVPLVKKYNLKFVLDLHENRPEIMKEYKHVQKFPGKFLINLNRWRTRQISLAKQADKVVVVTDLAREILVKDTGKSKGDVIVLPNTPSLSFLDYQLDQSIQSRMVDKFNLLYIGDTSARRGTEDMLHVVAKLKDSIPNVALWVIGTSSYDGELALLAKKLAIQSHVFFEGFQPERLFPSYILSAQVCLSPLKRNLHHDSTFANKVFQYMSLGSPSVVSDCTAQADLIQEEKAGLVYIAGDIPDFKSKIEKLYSDPGLRTFYGENAKKAVLERWHWEKTSKELISLYQSGF